MKTIDIFGKLVSKLRGGYVTSADQVYDETLGKLQSEINQESGEAGVDNKIEALVEKMPNDIKAVIESDGWDEFQYAGDHVTPPLTHGMRVRTLTDRFTAGQALAIWGDYAVRIFDGGNASLWHFTDDGIEKVANLPMDGRSSDWHCNSSQFAFTKSSGAFLPLLYIAGQKTTEDGGKCYVESITQQNGSYTTTLLQTITITPGTVMSHQCPNIQIGDDGYIYAFHATAPYLKCYKYRKVLASEGNVTLTDNDIIDYTIVDVGYVYNSKPWQGGKIYDGKLYFFWGVSSGRGMWVVDLISKKLLNEIDLTGKIPSGEMEDGDFRDGILHVGYWPDTNMVQIAFT